jgi:hypothetical protein
MDSFIASFERNIHQASSESFWFSMMGLTAVLMWCVYTAIKSYRSGYLISIVPTARIRSAAQGYVELIGKAKLMDGPVIVSPLTRKVCVWYRYKIEEKIKQANSKNSHWRTVKEETSDELFMLIDETGQCIVDPDDAEVIVKDKSVWYKHNVHPPRRYTEEIINESETLYAIGLFETMGSIDNQTLRQQVAHTLRDWKSDPNQLINDFDTNHDGKLDPDEWEQARQKAEQHVRREMGHQTKQQSLHVMKASPISKQNFILSTFTEQELVARYYRKATFTLLGFIASGSLIIWSCNIRLGI